MDQPGPDFDMVSASLRADTRDLAVFLDAFAAKVQPALPGLVWIEREGGLFRKEHPVKAIRIQLEDKIFEVYRVGAGVEARLLHSVQGVVLKKEVVHLEAWINELSQRLARHAQSSAEARAAIERLVT